MPRRVFLPARWCLSGSYTLTAAHISGPAFSNGYACGSLIAKRSCTISWLLYPPSVGSASKPGPLAARP